MIVIRSIRVGSTHDVKDFENSLRNNSSPDADYVIIPQKSAIPLRASIVIDLPDDCLVLHNSWDKYIKWNMDNGKTIDIEYVKKRMGIVDRRHRGLLPEIKVKYPSILCKLLSHAGITI